MARIRNLIEGIIFGLYGTIIKQDNHDGLDRAGFWEFIFHYKKPKKVICTDGERNSVRFDLSRMGLIKKFDRVYDREHCTTEGGILIKDLGRICSDLGISRKNVVLIGDNYRGTDKISAKLHKVKFIQVPQYRQNPPTQSEIKEMGKDVRFEGETNFSFIELIGKL